MTLTEAITNMFSKRASSPAQRAVDAGAPNATDDPTEGQKRVGNYRKVHLSLDGFSVSIENPKGSYRSGTTPDGVKWRNMLACDYGDIRGTEGTDGDPVDIYLSDHPEKGAVFVIDQIDPKTKKFDEHKVMYGFDSVEDAKKTYLACYQKGWGGLGWITPVTKAEFRKWIDSSGRKTKPFHEYASVKPIVDPIKVKAAESKDDDVDESCVVRLDNDKLGIHAYVKQHKDNAFAFAKDKKDALVFQHEEMANNAIESMCDGMELRPENFTVESLDPRADEPFDESELDKEAQAKDDDAMEGVPAGVKLRSFIDAPATRTAIMDNVLEAVKNRFPIEDDDVRLELKDVKYEGPTSYTLEQQKQALLGNRRLGCSIAGTWRLTDKKTGQVLDERRDGIIRVPYYTDRGTIINNGNEYTVISQARLSPGVYVRRKQNGELESQFNVANGLGFRIGLNKETGALNMSVGQGHVPLYPILRSMGVSDEDIRKSWGNEVTTVNAGKFDPRAIEKVYARYAGRKADPNLPTTEKAKFVSEALAGSGLDPDVVVRTLGLENVTGVTGQVMLRAAQKLLNINRGAEDPDERDNPRFSRYYGVEDMMRERIDKDAGRLTKSMLFRAKRDRSLARIGRNALAPYLDTFLSGSGLAMPGEEANPLSILTQQSRITRLGEGGISSPDLVTPEARNVQGDYLGYVDFISGPESFGIGIDVRAALGTMKGSDHRLYNKMMDLRTGKTRYVALDDAASHTVAFPGQDPKSPRLYAMRKGVPTMVPRDEVDYMVPGFGNTVSAGINMTPMPTAVQAGRQFYMSKFWEQYLPQKEGEVPLVDSLMDDGKTTYSEYYGRKVGCLTAPFAGTVIKANDKEIVIRGKDGQTHTASLVKGLPFNRMTSITFNSQVKKGDVVDEGSILANSNFTDAKTGAMNMGRNLKVAVLPAPEGVSSYEDAIVISESAAKKLATSRTYGYEQDTKEGVQVARNKYLAAFPKAYTKAQADTIDDNGVVKVGTVLHRDDPMILAIGPKMLSAEDAQLGKLSSVLRNALTDKSQKWEHDWPGVVTDVVAGPHGVKVLVNSDPPVKIGDKLAPENGLKGVVGGIIPDDKMPRDATTNEPYDMLMNPMGFLSRVAPGQVMLMNLAKVAKKTGKQIRIPQNPPPEGWQAWVENQMLQNGVKESSDVFDPQTGRTIKNVGDGYVYTKAFHHLAEKKYSARGVDGAYTQDEQPAKGGEDGSKRMCFTADQSIRVLHGEESIGHIVDKRIPEYVWTRFDDGSWGYSLVTNWFCRKGKMSEVLSISVNYLPGSDCCSRKRVVYTDKTMHVTKQHRMYAFYKGEVLAGDLRPGDWLTTYGYVPTDDQMSLLIGSMLGDACICNINDNLRKSDKECGVEAGSLPFYQEQHSHHQYAYVNWKVHCLGALVSSRKNTQRKSKTGFRRADGDDTNIVYCQIHRHDIAERLKNMFYRQPDGSLGRKNLDNVDLSKINDVGIVAWFLDDGCASEHKKNGVPTGSPFGSISTLNFTYEENCRLAEWLGGRLGTDVSVKTTYKEHDGTNRKYYYLSMSAEACRRMARLVARYVRPEDIPPSKKWLVKEVSRLSELYVGVDTAYTLGSVPALVTSVRPYNDGKHGPNDEICLYDITVNRSHKYCASDCLVSNSGFDMTALLSHGATDVIKDSMTTRGSINQDYWRRYRLGLPVEEPGVPFIYKKFINTLKAGGVNVVEKGDVTSIMPQTDADIDELAQGRVLENSQMVDSDFQPVKGGMFDLGKTGGMGGNRWSMIVLPEAVPNPMMEEPVRRVLGLTAKKMEAVLSGREELNGKTGGDAIKDALSKINVDAEIEKARAEIKNRRGSQRDNAIKVLGYLKAAKEMGKKPEDWMISRVPVLPPMFRPVAKMGDVALVPDMNELYKDLIEMKDNYEALAKELPASALSDERLAVYGAVKAAYGLGDPITTEGRAKNLKGAVRQVIGTVPKFGMYQSKVVSKTQDLVGRGVTTPDKNLDMDQIGLPEEMAWTIFRPFVERKLIQRGYSPISAKQMIEEKNPTARHLLDDVMGERPVLMDRAPTWHKFNIMAFRPHITNDRTIHVSPLCDSPMNGDHDGDTVNIHVPASDKAAKQAIEKMLPSKNLFSLTDMKSVRYKPEKEQISGLWALTRGSTRKPTRYFSSKAEAIAAYRNGEIGPNDPIEIKE
jgi:DNA-directed RNA polymerase beta subunit/DNA-directed RNA polymerase beta' subunit